MKKFLWILCLLPFCHVAHAQLAGPVTVYGKIIPGNCVKWHAYGVAADSGGPCGGTGAPGGSVYSIQYNNNGSFGGFIPSAIGTYCIQWTSLSAAPVPATCPSGTYPGAGIVVSTGAAWGTSITPGTGVETALGINVGSAGAFVVNGGPAGTPSSINLTNASLDTLPVSAINATGTASSTTFLEGDGKWATPSGTGTVTTTGTPTVGKVAVFSGSTSIANLSAPLPLIGYATASLPTCNSAATGQIAYTTDGTPALTFCNGTSWVNNGGTPFTVAGTGCTPTAATGDATGGSFTLAAGPCTAVTITFNGAVGMAAQNMWVCDVNDQTLQAAGTWFGSWGQSSSTTTTATIPIPPAAGSTDVITFSCEPH